MYLCGELQAASKYRLVDFPLFADLARWQASSITHLALLQQAFEVPATRPEEDVQLLLRSAEELAAGGVPKGGPGPLLQVGW